MNLCIIHHKNTERPRIWGTFGELYPTQINQGMSGNTVNAHHIEFQPLQEEFLHHQPSTHLQATIPSKDIKALVDVHLPWVNGLADRASSSNYQSANSGIEGLMGQPTGQVQVTTSQPTVGWWANGEWLCN